MPTLKPPQPLKPSAPPKAKVPESLPPPPRPTSLAGGVAARVPSIPAPKVPLAGGVAARVPSIPAPKVPLAGGAAARVPSIPAPKVPSIAAVPQAKVVEVAKYYVKVSDEILALDLAAIQGELDSGRFQRDTLICPVGANEWSTISAASHLKLRMPEISSNVDVPDGDFPVEDVSPDTDSSAVQQSKPSGTIGASKRVLPLRTKVTLTVWALSAATCAVIVLQRDGSLHSAAGWLGLSDSYEALEKDLIGGPGTGTVRSVEQLWSKSIPEGALPFSEGKKLNAQPEP